MRYGWLVRGATLFESMTNQGGSATRIFDLDQDPPAEIGRANGLVADVLEAGDGYLYAGRFTDLQVWDVRNLAAPVQVASLPLTTSLLQLAGGVLYVASIDYSVSLKELVAVDVSVPGAPKRLGSVPLELHPVALASVGRSLLAVGSSDQLNELFVFDVSHPAVPVLASRIDLGAQLFDVEADGSTAYVATSAGLTVVDVSDPVRPLVLAVACPPDEYAVNMGHRPDCTARHVAVTDDLVWTFGNRAVAWDVRNRAWPRAVSTSTLSGDNVEAHWPWLYMAQVGYSASLPVFRFDVSRPQNVVHLLYPPLGLQPP
jgi:hypothetical protein